MKIFVTGVSGFLGRSIVEQAGLDGHEVVGLDLVPWPAASAVPPHVRFVRGTLDDMNLVRGLLAGCDGMIHGAALHMDHMFSADFGDYIHTNVELAVRLLDAAIAANVRRFVLASSLTVVLGKDYTQCVPSLIREDQPLPIGFPYSISKLALEVIAREWARMHDVPVAMLRFSGFGHDCDGRGQNLLAREMSGRDAARACLCALQRNDERGEVYHIGSGTPLTQDDIRRALDDPRAALEHRYPGALDVLERHGRDVIADNFYPVFVIDKAKRQIGYEPLDTFENWLLAHRWQPSVSHPCPTIP
jgi:nucleoside-diphosphate-sugar epimerase